MILLLASESTNWRFACQNFKIIMLCTYVCRLSLVVLLLGTSNWLELTWCGHCVSNTEKNRVTGGQLVLIYLSDLCYKIFYESTKGPNKQTREMASQRSFSTRDSGL